MTDKFEQHIETWFSKPQSRNLDYLNLAENSRVSLSEIAHNLEVTHNEVCFLCKGLNQQFRSLQKETISLRKEVNQLRESVSFLEKNLVSQQPVSKTEVRTIVQESLETFRVSNNSDKIIHLLKELKSLISG